MLGFTRSAHKDAPSSQQGAEVDLDELLQLRFRAKNLALRQRKKLMSIMAGGKQSGFRGRGVDFVEVRHYQPGDDIRAIDWRVTARSNHPHTKIFSEERERPVFILSDYSPSMWFGTRAVFKSVQAARTAALLAWASLQQGDRVGGLIYSPESIMDLRPSGGRRGVMRLLRALAAPRINGTHNAEPKRFSHALAQLRHVAHPGSLICLISDFYALDADAERHLNLLARHNDVLAIFIYDPLERELPPPGRYPITDGQHISLIDTHARNLREHYQQAFLQRQQSLEQLFKQRGLRLLSLATDENAEDLLGRALNPKAS